MILDIKVKKFTKRAFKSRLAHCKTAHFFVDKDTVHRSVIETLLIGVEGAKTPPKMLTHFHRAWADSRKPINVLWAQLDR
jgi:hypothetical protein